MKREGDAGTIKSLLWIIIFMLAKIGSFTFMEYLSLGVLILIVTQLSLKHYKEYLKEKLAKMKGTTD